MKRNSALKIVNPILGLLVLSQACTGLLGDKLPEEVFEVMHEGGGIALVSAAVLHLILNWNWVKANYAGKKTAAGA